METMVLRYRTYIVSGDCPLGGEDFCAATGSLRPLAEVQTSGIGAEKLSAD
jgi:hypothetical protein